MSNPCHPRSLLHALAFASEKHRTQRRKDADASPYINHPILVAQILAVIGGVEDEATLIAAILHDTVEDTQTSFEELEAEFGAEVRGIVAEVTDDKTLPWQRRKELQVEHAPHRSEKARLVKIADKIANLRDLALHPPAGWGERRRGEYVDWSERVVTGCRGVNVALDGAVVDAIVHARRALGAALKELGAESEKL